MTKLEERLRSGLHEAAERIPDSLIDAAPREVKARRLGGVWMAVAAVFIVMALFSPLLFLNRSQSGSVPGGITSPAVPDDVTLAAVGFEFANPEHVRLQFTQTLTLSCDGLETIDNGGFDNFTLDLWIDNPGGFTRFSIVYPDGSTYDLIYKGPPNEWEQAWGRGTDRGRAAGCRETLEDGGYQQSVAGWAYQDASPMWFTAYLKPVSPAEDGGVEVNFEEQPTLATPIGSSRYVIEGGVAESSIRNEYALDASGIRVVGEERSMYLSEEFEATAIIDVVESGPTALPQNVFDTTEFAPLWGGDPVPTTVGSS
jgi:hypothetical protein